MTFTDHTTHTENILFRPINLSDISLIHTWFNNPHVQQFYSLRAWSETEVLKKLKPVIENTKPVFGFIILHDDKPIGYIQYYAVINFPWPHQDLSEQIIQKSAGIDLFIGDKDFVGKGYGANVIKQFLDKIIWPNFDYCVVDPDMRNLSAIYCYKKLGFKTHKIIKTEDALKRDVELQLMILSKDRE